jgi:hypothetical protein
MINHAPKALGKTPNRLFYSVFCITPVGLKGDCSRAVPFTTWLHKCTKVPDPSRSRFAKAPHQKSCLLNRSHLACLLRPFVESMVQEVRHADQRCYDSGRGNC